jgi:hypothetical protein
MRSLVVRTEESIMREITRCDNDLIVSERTTEKRVASVTGLALSLGLVLFSGGHPPGSWIGGALAAISVAGMAFARRSDGKIRLDPRERSVHRERAAGVSQTLLLDDSCYLEVTREASFYDLDSWGVYLRLPESPDYSIPLLDHRRATYASMSGQEIGRLLGLEVLDHTTAPNYAGVDPRKLAQALQRAPDIDEANADLVAKGLEELTPSASRRKRSWLPALSVDEVLRSDEEELRVAVPKRSRWFGAGAFGLSGLTIWAVNSVRIERVTHNPSDHELLVLLTNLAALLAIIAGYWATGFIRPGWVSIRNHERVIRGRRGWLSRFRFDFGEVQNLVVERKRGMFNTGSWEISFQSDEQIYRVARTSTGRDARVLAEAMSRRLGVRVLDLSGALPPLVSQEVSKDETEGAKPVQETPEQQAARSQIDQILNRAGASIARWRAATIAASITGSILPLVTASRIEQPVNLGLWLLSLSPYVIFDAICLFGWYRAQARMGDEFEEVDSVAAVGPLLDLAAESSGGLSTGVQKALSKLLKRLKPTDRTTLTPKQRASLRRLLSPSKVQALWSRAQMVRSVQVAALQALEQIGDERDIPAVESMLANATADIRREIAHCLEALYHRDDASRSGSTLLRAYDATVGTEALLRPAKADCPMDPATLLRTADAEPEVESRYEVEAPQELTVEARA